MLDNNDKNKFKPQKKKENLEITIIQHTLLENEYPERGRKLYIVPHNLLLQSIRKRIPREGTKTHNSFSFLFSFFKLENEYPERGRKRFFNPPFCYFNPPLENEYPERGRKLTISSRRISVLFFIRKRIPREGTKTWKNH